MSPANERRLLQLAVALASMVPIIFGAMGIARGAGWLDHGPVTASLDSHFRYMSGIFFVLGLGFASCVPQVEAMGPRFRLLGTMVIVGGIARAISMLVVGIPSAGHVAGLVMELGVVPAILFWQARVARMSL